MEGEEPTREQLIAKAKRLESKLLYAKSGDIYAKLGMDKEAGQAYETAGDLKRAIEYFKKAGCGEDVKRCEQNLKEKASGKTWQDLQKEFQDEAGNPY
ncbi:MAG: hypothetical protein WC506_01190 [Candidatus Micrarchaeia archaeon]